MTITPALLERARQGDETAQSAIIAHLMPHIRRAAAINTYQPQQHAAFDTYAIRCVRNAIADARRRAGRKKHLPLNQSVPLDERQATPGPEEQAVHREEYRATIRILRTRLSSVERRVLLLYLDGCSYQAIARRLGLTVKAVGNALTRARSKLKNGRELP